MPGWPGAGIVGGLRLTIVCGGWFGTATLAQDGLGEVVTPGAGAIAAQLSSDVMGCPPPAVICAFMRRRS